MKKTKSITKALLLLLGITVTYMDERFSALGEEKAENQYFCFFGGVYKEEKGKCVSVFEETLSVLKKAEPKKADVTIKTATVIYSVTAKKGDGCLSLTKNTKKPLSLGQCRELARTSLRIKNKTTGNQNARSQESMIHIGDTWELIQVGPESDKVLLWSVPKKG